MRCAVLDEPVTRWRAWCDCRAFVFRPGDDDPGVSRFAMGSFVAVCLVLCVPLLPLADVVIWLLPYFIVFRFVKYVACTVVAVPPVVVIRCAAPVSLSCLARAHSRRRLFGAAAVRRRWCLATHPPVVSVRVGVGSRLVQYLAPRPVQWGHVGLLMFLAVCAEVVRSLDRASILVAFGVYVTIVLVALTASAVLANPNVYVCGMYLRVRGQHRWWNHG